MENGKLTLEGKIATFKTIATSKIVFQSFITLLLRWSKIFAMTIKLEDRKM